MLGSNFESFVPTAVVSTPLSFFLFFVDGFKLFAAVPAASRSATTAFLLLSLLLFSTVVAPGVWRFNFFNSN